MKSLLVLALFSIIFVGFVGIAEAYDGSIRADLDKKDYFYGDKIIISGTIYGSEPIENQLVTISFIDRTTQQQVDTALVAVDSFSSPFYDEIGWNFSYEIDTTNTDLQSEQVYDVIVGYDDVVEDLFLKFRDSPAQQAITSSQSMQEQQIKSSEQTHEIPDWVKSVFAMYSRGEISDSELIAAIQFLISVNIIKV